MTEPLTTTEPMSDNLPARTALAAATVLISAVLAIPAFTGSDDFPVSSQPMFAVPRAETAEFVTARGIDVGGEPVALSIGEIAQTDDPLVAEVLLLDAQRTNTLAASCQAIADRVERPMTAIEIVRVNVNLDDGLKTSDLTAAEARTVEVLERCGAR